MIIKSIDTNLLRQTICNLMVSLLCLFVQMFYFIYLYSLVE